MSQVQPGILNPHRLVKEMGECTPRLQTRNIVCALINPFATDNPMDLPRSLIMLTGLAPLAVLFNILLRRDRERLWRRFLLYSIWALACGFLAVFWAGPMTPIYDAYMLAVTKVLSAFGAAGLSVTFKSAIESGGRLFIWDLGMFAGIWWITWRNRSDRETEVRNATTKRAMLDHDGS